MKSFKTILYILLCFSSFYLSNSCTKSKVYIDFEAANESNINAIQQKGTNALTGKGETWKMWNKIYTDCLKSQLFNDPFYFGVSNTIGLGSITDKKHESIIKIADTSIFTQEEINSFMKVGQPTTCEYAQELTMNLNALLNTQFSVTNTNTDDITAELNVAISTAKSTSIKIDGWQKDELLTGVLRDILNETSDRKKLKFKEDLYAPGNLILVRVAKINGFSSEIKTKNEISSKLEAKLKDGVIATIGNTGVKANFEYVNKTTIRVKSNGEFYIFGQFMKGKKVDKKPN